MKNESNWECPKADVADLIKAAQALETDTGGYIYTERDFMVPDGPEVGASMILPDTVRLKMPCHDDQKADVEAFKSGGEPDLFKGKLSTTEMNSLRSKLTIQTKTLAQTKQTV